MSQHGNYQSALQAKYEKAVIAAKDAGIEFGLYSTEYAEAVKKMNNIWLSKKMTLSEKVTNYLIKKIWQIKKRKGC